MDDSFLVEFSHENSEAAFAEIRAVESSGRHFEIIEANTDYAIVKGNPDNLKACSFVSYVSKIEQEKDSWEDFLPINDCSGAFYLRIKDFNGCHNSDDEPILGNTIKGSNKVRFREPDFKLRAVHGKKWYLGTLIHTRDNRGFETRRAPLRPFFSPVAIHPKYARFLVNLTRTVPGEVIFDPFCGTGGILLEAALMGRATIGNDISLNMVKGARLNLKYFGIKDFEIYNKDTASLSLKGKVDGIATDLPYGRNSNMSSSSLSELYSMAFERFSEWLKPGKYCAVILSDTALLKHSRSFFNIVNKVAVPQHRSLTRYFVGMSKL